MQHLEACIVDFYFNIKDIKIYYSEKWSVRYEVNIVGCKVLKTLDLRLETLDLRIWVHIQTTIVTKRVTILAKKIHCTAGEKTLDMS